MMRNIPKLCRSVLSGTLAMAVISATAVMPLTAYGAETANTDSQSALETAGEVRDGFDTEGSIVFVEEPEAAEAADTVASAEDSSVPETTPAAVSKPINVSMAEENGYRYYITGGNAVIDSYIGEETAIEVPETLGGEAVSEIGYAAFAGNQDIVSVRIPESVKRINHDAFSGCTALVRAELPDDIISIQDGAFSDCESLSEITLPNGISRIEDNVFRGCKSLADIELSSNIDYIGKSAFSDCTALASFTVPESVTAIGNLAFSGSGLESMEVPDTVTSLGYSVFADCTALKEAVLPKDITKLKSGSEKGMFSGCSSLEKVTFPEKLTEIGDMAFAACTSLETIALPETVTVIGNELFRDCEKLEQVTIPQSVTRIGDGMFSGCVSLPGVDLHDGIAYIGSYAFEGCTSLTELVIPAKTAVIGDRCFFGCGSLTGMEIPASVTSLGAAALAGCSSLETVTLPDGITAFGSIEEYGLFTDDIALKEVKLPASLKDLGANTFRNCVSLTEIRLPETVTGIGSSAFENCLSLKEITLPDGAVRLSEKAFRGCTALNAVILPKNFDEAADRAFENCSSLTALGDKAGFFKFAENTFTGCGQLNDERATVFQKNSPVVNVSSAASIVGGVANFSIRYDLNDWIRSGFADADNADIRFLVPLPAGLAIIDSSVTTDTADNKVTFIGNGSDTFAVTKPEGTLRFSARIEAYNDQDYTIDPKICFVSHQYSWCQKIPRMSLTVPKITISAQNTVSGLSCEVYGIAEPGRKVKIYVDGALAASVTANQYTGKYVSEITLPEKDGTASYSIYAECGVNRTAEVSTVYSSFRPLIRKVELIYCSHAPTNLNDYMETLDITGIFTRGERPVIQFYPKGNMRFRIEVDHAEKIQAILVKSTKGSEIKYLYAGYDAKEGAFITSQDDFFDESNHNYVPGSLNFVMIEKTSNYIDASDVDAVLEEIESDKIDREFEIVDDSSCISSIVNKDGEIITDCYYGVPETVAVNGENVTANQIAEAAADYGFEDTGKKVVSDSGIYSVYSRVTQGGTQPESTGSAYDNSVLDTVDTAYSAVRPDTYETGDYTVYSQLMVPENQNTDAYLFVTAAAETSVSRGTGLTGNAFSNQGTSSPRGTYIPTYYPSGSGGTGSTGNTGNTGNTGSTGSTGNTGNSGSSFTNPFDFSDPYGSLEYYGDKVANFCIQLGQADYNLDPLGQYGSPTVSNVSNVSTLFNLFGGVVKGYEFYNDYNAANERYNQDVQNYQGNSSRDQYNRQLADTRRTSSIFLSYTSKIVTYLPVLGDGYSVMLTGINGMLDKLFDGVGRYYDQFWEIEEAVPELFGDDDEESGDGFRNEYPHDGKVNTVIDPSGVVYEGVKSKTVSGAVVTCYVLNEDTGAWEIWNAEDYDQKNPLMTDEAGAYAWDVPEGRYYVTCEKDGYDTIKSEEFDVAPPKYDLDFNLLDPAAPAVKGYTLSENAIEIAFSKVMDIATVNAGTVSLRGIGGEITVTPQLYADGDLYTDKFIITGDFSNALRLTLTVSGDAADYTGTALTAYSAEIENIYADLVLESESVKLLTEDTYQIKTNKEIASYTSDDPEIAAVDENGVVTAVSEGTAKITVKDIAGKEAVLTVQAEKKLVVDEKTAGKLERLSLRDYYVKTGEKADSAECKIVDNKCIVELKDKDGNILDVYTVDPDTRVGTDSDGDTVDLPLTGVCSPETLLWAIAAIILLCAGAFAVRASGVTIRKRKMNE